MHKIEGRETKNVGLNDWEIAEDYLVYWEKSPINEQKPQALTIKKIKSGEIYTLRLNLNGDLSYLKGKNSKLFPNSIRSDFELTDETRDILTDFKCKKETEESVKCNNQSANLMKPIRNIFAALSASLEANLPVPGVPDLELPTKKIKLPHIHIKYKGTSFAENAEDCYQVIVNQLLHNDHKLEEYKKQNFTQIVLELYSKSTDKFYEKLNKYLSSLARNRKDFCFTLKLLDSKNLVVLAWYNLYPDRDNECLYLSEDVLETLNYED